MKVNVESNIKEITKWTTNAQKKQIPFATAQAINATLGINSFSAKNKGKGLDGEMKKQMIKKLDRPMSKTTNAFYRIQAKKNNLTGTLGFFDWASKFMGFLIEGGVRSTGKNIPVPFIQNARLNKHGNIIGKKSGLIKKKSQFIGNVGGKDGVFERRKGETPTMIIGFKRSVNYKAIFPFYKIATNYCSAVFDRNFTKAFNKALKSAKK